MKRHNILCLVLIPLLVACASGAEVAEEPEKQVQPQVIEGEWQEPDEPEPVEVSGEVQDFSCTAEEFEDGLYCFGLISNTSDVPANYEVILTKRDSEGNLEFRESTYVSDLIKGTSGIFQMYSLDIEDCDGCEVSLNPSAMTWGEIYTDVVVLSHKINKLDYTDGYEIIGEVENAGNKDVEYAAITAGLFDDQGKLMGVGLTFPDKNPLPAGEKATFSLLIMNVLEGNFKDYKIYPVVVSIN